MLSTSSVAEGSQPHETWVKLLREAPGLTIELVRRARPWGLDIPRATRAAVVGSEVVKARPDSLRADLVLRLDTARALTPSAMIVEVQLGEDEDKRLKWPVYVAGVRAELGCPATLVVVAPSTRVAEWARTRIETGHPGFVLEPVVLGPEAIPVVADARAARRDVRLAVLSAMAHGRSTHAYEVGLAALRAVARLDEGKRADYATYVLDALDEPVLRQLEETMDQGRHRELTSLEKHFIAKGEAKGRAEGEAEGRLDERRHAVLRVLAARGLGVPDAIREHVLACADADELERLHTRAATANRAEDVLAD
jgi:hypothetical protein